MKEAFLLVLIFGACSTYDLLLGDPGETSPGGKEDTIDITETRTQRCK